MNNKLMSFLASKDTTGISESLENYDKRMMGEVDVFNLKNNTKFSSFDSFHDYMELQEKKYCYV